MKKSFITCLFLGLSTQVVASDAFRSSTFNYEDPIKAERIHVTLKGETWLAEDVKPQDTPFFASIYSDATIMSKFAGGVTRSKQDAEVYAAGRVKVWTDRFTNGQPHGGLIVKNLDGHSIGHIVAGGGDEPGASEVAYFLTPGNWGHHLGTQLVNTIVTIWAPEVVSVGRGNHGEVTKKFQCFGGLPLSRLDATAGPSNPASWKILVKNGFQAAKSRVVTPEGEYIIDLDGKDFAYPAVEQEVLKLFQLQDGGTALLEGTRYRMVDTGGDEKTVSYHKAYDCLKYHFEYLMK